MLRLDDITARIGDYCSDAILITLAEPFEPPGPMIVWCNRAFSDATGYTLDEVRGKSPRILQGPETDIETLKRMGRELRAWREVRAEVKNYRKDGSTFWSELLMRPIADSAGWYRYWISIQRDVTARKEQETTLAARVEALRAATARLEAERAEVAGIAAVAELSSDLVAITDPEFRILWANRAFLDRNGFSLGDVRGRVYCDLMGKSSLRHGSREAAIRAVLDGECAPGETLNTTPDGEEYWTETHIAVERDASGRPSRFVLVEREITESRRLREELRARSDDLQALVEQRTSVIQAQSDELARALERQKRLNEQQIQFIRMASHEFRTPMSVISMATRQIRRRLRKGETAEAEERLGVVDDSIARLTKLVDSTLFLAKVDAGQYQFDIKPLDMRGWMAARIAAERGAGLRHEIRYADDCDGPAEVSADPALLDHVFDNLLGNARKYSPDADRIEVRLWLEDESVRAAIRDFGVGVSPEDLAKLGERYFRAQSAQGIAGTGIGLTVVKQFVDLLGGALVIESVEGEGSTFTVILPLAAAHAAQGFDRMVEGVA